MIDDVLIARARAIADAQRREQIERMRESQRLDWPKLAVWVAIVVYCIAEVCVLAIYVPRVLSWW